jgi:hypothetical protein
MSDEDDWHITDDCYFEDYKDNLIRETHKALFEADLSWMKIQKDLVLSIINYPKVASWGNGFLVQQNRVWDDLDPNTKANLLFSHFSKNGTLSAARDIIGKLSDGQIGGNTYHFNDVKTGEDERQTIRNLLNSDRGDIIRQFFLDRL